MFLSTEAIHSRTDELVTLDNKICLSKSAATSVHTLESLGQGQFKDFNTNVLESTNVKLEAPIKRNNLILFTETTKRKPAAVHGRVQHFKEQADLFGKAFLVLESRGGNLTEFFRHESAIYPPALSSRGKMNSCTKSNLLNCILDADTTSNLSAEIGIVPPDAFQAIIIDGGALIHSLPGKQIQGNSVDDYFAKIFLSRIKHELVRSTRVDVVWDDHRDMSIKGGTREKRGSGTRQRVTGSAKVPRDWQKF